MANELPAGSRIGGPENLEIRLGEGALYEIEDEWIVVDSNKLDGRRGTYGLISGDQQLNDIPVSSL